MEIVIRKLEMWLELGSKPRQERDLGDLCIELIWEALELEDGGEQEEIHWQLEVQAP